MRTQFVVLLSMITLLLLSACTPAKTSDTGMGKATEAMAARPTSAARMEATTTPEAMMDKATSSAMTNETATPGAMMEVSSTPDAMMAKPTSDAPMGAASTPDAMMVTPTTGTMREASSTPDAMMAKPTPDTMMGATAAPDTMMHATTVPAMPEKPTGEAMMDAAAWTGAALTNANTGESFSLAGFKGKVVLVEMMAQWCPTCKQQQAEIKSLHEKLGMPPDLVTVSLDIDPNEDAATLKTYTANNGFDWIYAVAPAGVSHEIGSLYGDQFLNPPSTPMLIIDRKGEIHLLPFGVKRADDLMKAIQPYLSGM